MTATATKKPAAVSTAMFTQAQVDAKIALVEHANKREKTQLFAAAAVANTSAYVATRAIHSRLVAHEASAETSEETQGLASALAAATGLSQGQAQLAAVIGGTLIGAAAGAGAYWLAGKAFDKFAKAPDTSALDKAAGKAEEIKDAAKPSEEVASEVVDAAGTVLQGAASPQADSAA